MRFFFISIVSVLFLLGCGSSSLQVNENGVIIKHKGSTSTLDTIVLNKELDRYDNIDITKYKLDLKNEILFYENVDIDLVYEFSYNPKTTIGYIFEGMQLNLLYEDEQFYFMQLAISPTQHINILVEASGVSELNYLYGFSDETFMSLLEKFKVDAKAINMAQATKSLSLEKNSEHLSKWSVKMLLLQPLIETYI